MIHEDNGNNQTKQATHEHTDKSHNGGIVWQWESKWKMEGKKRLKTFQSK